MMRIMLLLLGLLLLGTPAWADLRLQVPATVSVGQPFEVSVSAPGLQSVELTWLDRSIPLDVRAKGAESTAEALLGVDVRGAKPGPRTLVLDATVAGKRQRLERSVAVTAKAYPEQRLRVAESMAETPPELVARLEAEHQAAVQALATVSPARRWSLPLLRPLEGRVSSIYGLRRFFNDKPRDPHRGLDLATPMGTPVAAAADGTVILVAEHYLAGRSVYVDHGEGVISVYFHLSEFLVHEGEQVRAGQVIARSGKTGRATAPHLHFGLYVMGQAVDPVPALRPARGGS